MSTSFNLSLGFAPAILTILLGELIAKDFAIYIGALMGVVYSLSNYYKNHPLLPNLILYTVTAVMLVFSLISLFRITDWPKNSLSITLELAIILPLLFFYSYRTKLETYIRKRTKPTTKRHYIEAAESAIVSIKLVLIFTFAHFAVFTVLILFSHSLSSQLLWVLQALMPALVFAATIMVNQIGLRFFNKEMSGTEFIPLVNDKGDVTGKIIKDDIPEQGNNIMVPIVRIAIERQGMLFLSRNNSFGNKEGDKTDTPLKSYVLFNDTLENTLKIMLQWAFPGVNDLDPRFSIKYKFTGNNEVKLVYLFILNINDDNLLRNIQFINGKLWTLQQIEANLGKGFFSDLFEYEFEHLKDVIEIRERYREA